MLFDDDRPKKPATHELGSDLSMLSVEELRARITLLKGEIDRIEAEIGTKDQSRGAAEDVFRKK
jgi:uncharacterized small protein (DUF1192 family)